MLAHQIEHLASCLFVMFLLRVAVSVLARRPQTRTGSMEASSPTSSAALRLMGVSPRARAGAKPADEAAQAVRKCLKEQLRASREWGAPRVDPVPGLRLGWITSVSASYDGGHCLYGDGGLRNRPWPDSG